MTGGAHFLLLQLIEYTHDILRRAEASNSTVTIEQFLIAIPTKDSERVFFDLIIPWKTRVVVGKVRKMRTPVLLTQAKSQY